MAKTWQKFSQIIFLVLFAVLIITGRMQLWMGLFALSVILALLFGRFYCGWICPINTLMKGIIWVKRKLKIGKFNTPFLITHPFFRYAFLAIFLLAFVFVMKTGRKLPVLPALLALGAGLTLFFPEELWHRYLCPYGTILNLTGSHSRRALTLDAGSCSGCGTCSKVCSAGAVGQTAGKKYEIDRGLCLLCLDCVARCPQDAIQYHRRRKV
ncbi:MAG: 4Fe-4S binding protein [Firmicutes bacterium]|nr:4Fe-4S binding protein [Bacillota bacterium]